MSKTNKTTTINGVDVIEDGDVTHFRVSEETCRSDAQKRQLEEDPNLSFWQKLGCWFRKHDVKPCVRSRDLADPFYDRRLNPDDIDVGSDGRRSVEFGFKGTF